MSQKIPQHVAVVMDGNGRWAESRGLPRNEGHRAGVESAKAIVQACLEKNIPVLSLFAFSRENWGRPSDEVEFLMQLFVVVVELEIENLNSHGICIRFIGDRDQLSQALREKMDSAEALTRHNNNLFLNIAVNYTGKWDIVQAVKKMIGDIQSEQCALEAVDEQLFSTYMSTSPLPDPDLLIRTSGEQRISDFFLWQIAFTEFYFTDVNWPEFTTQEFEHALAVFNNRERRYGLTSKQLNDSAAPKGRHV